MSTAKRFMLPLIVASAMISPALASDTWDIDSAHSSARFSVRHMMISNVNGQFSKVSGKVEYDGKALDKAKVDATIPVGTVNTQEPGRDEHLRGKDFFDAAAFPDMTFKSKKIVTDKDGFKIYGDLTLHGVTKEVVLQADPLAKPIKDPKGKTRIGASATGKINRKDFGISFNKAMDNGGAMVGDDVKITLDVELVKEG
ncbi:MAG TPA: YceI family protein [Chroococcales cyanobacterium]